MCIMDHARVESAVIMGIDFGAQVAYEAGRQRPDRFIGVFAADIPVSTPTRLVMLGVVILTFVIVCFCGTAIHL